MIVDRIFNEVDLNSGDRGRLHRKIFIMDWGKQLGTQLRVFGCVWQLQGTATPRPNPIIFMYGIFSSFVGL